MKNILRINLIYSTSILKCLIAGGGGGRNRQGLEALEEMNKKWVGISRRGRNNALKSKIILL